MSLGEKLLEAIKEFNQKIRDQFPETWGLYHNVSNTLFIEVFGDNLSINEKSKITWRTGEIELGTSREETLEVDTAIMRLMEAMNHGYTPVCLAKNAEDLEKAKKILFDGYSLIKQSGKLGTYVKGDYWIRIKEYTKNIYSIESGYKGLMEDFVDRNESDTLMLLSKIEAEGYRKEGLR